ncbi:major facilitator superfamily domain-containing protein [Sporodiniella umbellata]|nr:major facilitator superfamily domain-containing protein [Sporodiniella umbellata]
MNEETEKGKLIKVEEKTTLTELALVRSNIGNARLGGLEADLKMTANEYQWSLSIFYFSYVLFDLPSNIIMRRWRPSYWLGILMFLWGTVATVMAASQNFATLALCRFLIGVFEAGKKRGKKKERTDGSYVLGFFPGVIYFMSLWYTRREYGQRISLFWSFSSLAGAFGGLIAYAISQISSESLKPWQWLFLVEGGPTVVLALFSAWYLPNQPSTASFLNAEEKRRVEDRLSLENGEGEWSWSLAFSVFKDWKLYIYMAIYITGTSALQGVTLFLPSIVAGMGTWSLPMSQALTVPPYLLAFLTTIYIGWSSDRYFERGYHMMATNSLALVGFPLLAFLPPSFIAGRYVASCLVTMGVYANVPVKVAWFNNNYHGLSRRAVASAAIVSVGTAGGIVGSHMYHDAPRFMAGHLIAFSCVAMQSVLVVILRWLLARENKKGGEFEYVL